MGFGQEGSTGRPSPRAREMCPVRVEPRLNIPNTRRRNKHVALKFLHAVGQTPIVHEEIPDHSYDHLKVAN